MRQRRRTPTLAEAHQAFLRKIESMTREDWIRSIEELSRAPEGVEDPWPPYHGPILVNGASGTSNEESNRPDKP